MDKVEVGGKRLFIIVGYFLNWEILDIVRIYFFDLEDCLLLKDLKGGDLVLVDKICKYNNEEIVKILGIKWMSLEDSMVELVKFVKDKI